MPRYRAFAVHLPSGVRYWTVLGPDHRTVMVADDYLLYRRLGADAAELTTQAYAGALALFFDWCDTLSLDWREAPAFLGRFVYWLQWHGAAAPLIRGGEPVRGARRVNAILAAVRGFFRFSCSVGAAPAGALTGLYDEFTAQSPQWTETPTLPRPRARHRLHEPASAVDNATDEEVLALLSAASHARDRFIVIAMWRMGLRRGELVGLRRQDLHLVPDAGPLGCAVEGPHVHVTRRHNANGATAKSRRSRAVPADWTTVQAYDQYVSERCATPGAAKSDFLLVNLFREPVGGPMRPDAINALLSRLSKAARCGRTVKPHMLRHSFGTNAIEAGASLDVLKQLLGHAWITSTEVYLHPSPARLRDAVDNVATPRGGPNAEQFLERGRS